MNPLPPCDEDFSRWTPRRPSAGLERRIFGRPRRRDRTTIGSAWAAPALAACALALVASRPLPPAVPGPVAGTSTVLAFHWDGPVGATGRCDAVLAGWTNLLLRAATNTPARL